jgi:hypothetical protein
MTMPPSTISLVPIGLSKRDGQGRDRGRR